MADTVNIPVVDALGPTVEAAKNFQALDITGVLFIVLFVLAAVILYKFKNDKKIEELANSIREVTSVSKETMTMLQNLHQTQNNNVLDRVRQIEINLEKIEDHCRRMELTLAKSNILLDSK
jgi:hypothetical protein|nr:MAG TPA: hypothetical protein [Caudoviricetes sp.]